MEEIQLIRRRILSWLGRSGAFWSLLSCASCAVEVPSPDPPPGAERAALLVLELVEARGPESSSGPSDGAVILDGLQSPSRLVRARAARAAGRWGRDGGKTVPALIELARNDPDPVVVLESVFALGQLRDPAASAVLAEAALDPLPALRAVALEALGKIPGTPPGLLLSSLADPAPEARGGAVLGLARLSPAPASEKAGRDAGGDIVRRLDVERDGQVIWKLHYLLSLRPDLMARPEIQARSVAALGSPNWIAAVFAAGALEHTPEGEAQGAGSSLQVLEGPVEALRRAARDPHRFWLARAAAVRALKRLSPAGDPSGEEGFPSRQFAALLSVAPSASRVPSGGPDPAQLEPALGEGREAVGFFSPTNACLRRDPRASITLAGGGRVRIQLFVGEAPQAVARFARLARRGFYNGMGFRPAGPDQAVRASAGGPEGAGRFGLREETWPVRFLRGAVVAGRLDSRRGEGCFFIALVPTPQLDGRATHFATVVEGMEVVDRLGESDAIESITIEGWAETEASP